MKTSAILLGLSIASLGTAFDAKQDCQNALAAAKKAGLPTSAADLKVPAPSKASRDLESLIDRTSAAVGRGTPGPVLIAQIEKIAASSAPRAQSTDFSPMGHFPRQAKMKAIVRAYLTHVDAALMAKNPAQVSTRFRTARKLINLARTDDSLIALLSQISMEGQYFAYVKKAAKAGGGIALAVLPLVDPFPRPSIARVLQVDYWQSLQTFAMATQSMNLSSSPKTITLPSDPTVLKLITRHTKSWTKAYSALKGCRTSAELAAKYKAIEPKLDRESNGEGGFLILGPEWAKRGLATEKVDKSRQEAIQALKKFKK